MPLLDQTGRIEESWQVIGDDDAVPAQGDVMLSLARFAADAGRIAGRKGLLVPSDAALDAIALHAANVAVIGVRFATFKDGRPFSLGHLIRTRLGFKGDLRAFGPFLPDQALFLARTGFTSFNVPDGFDDGAFKRIMAGFSHAYQGQPGPLRTIASMRHGTDGRNDWGRLIALKARYRDATAETLTAAAIQKEFPNVIALSSSFGAESAVLLHMVASIDRATPVLFLDTGKLFPETHQYRDELVTRLGLTQVQIVTPAANTVAAHDIAGTLWLTNADACCGMRKVAPFDQALKPFQAWITGRKAAQGGARTALDRIELVEGRFKFNPLAHWSNADTADYLEKHDLPLHPLVAHGFRSIGCVPCTSPVKEGEASRAGRWRGREKTECGIHERLKRVAPS